MSVTRSRRFAGRPASIGQARAWATHVLDQLGCDAEAVSTARLIVSELATNAVCHSASGRAGGSFHVAVTRWTGHVRLQVADQGGSTEPITSPQPQELGEHGRGLWMIARMAVRVGIFGDHTGRRVFADLPTPTHPGTQADPDAAGVVVRGWSALIPALELPLESADPLTDRLRALLDAESGAGAVAARHR